VKRVLLINGSSKPLKCGVGYYGDILAHELAKSCDIQLLTTSGLGDEKNIAGLHHTDNWKISSLPKIIKIIRSVNPNVVHIQYPAVGYGRQLGINLLPLCLRFLANKTPVVVTLHEYYGSAMLGKIRNIITVFAAKKIIVSNQYDKDALPGFFQKKSSIIPIGHTFSPSAKNRAAYDTYIASVGLSTTKPVIAYFGFVNPSKGLDVLVRSATKINAQILILADLSVSNTYHNKLLSDIKIANEQGATIHVAGFLNDTMLSQILHECTLFALAQPLPLTAKSSTAIVAAEHGLVIVSTAAKNPIYNLPYVGGKNSILLHDMTEHMFTKACNDIINDPKKLQNLKKNLPDLTANFKWSSISKKHIVLYDTVMR